MDALSHLAIMWAAVFAAVVLAKRTRMTPVLYFLFMGSLLANVGVLPAESGAFIRIFSELGIIFIMCALGFEESTDNFLAGIKRSRGHRSVWRAGALCRGLHDRRFRLE